MGFYFDVEYRKGNHLGGHNCESVKMDGEFLRLGGYDMVLDYEGDYVPEYWLHIVKIEDIKSFKLEVMEEVGEE